MAARILRSAVIGTWPFFALAIPLALLVLVAASVSDTLEQRAVLMLLNLIVVVGTYVFIGNSGVLSFGHISFMAIGAYACAIVSIPPIMKGFLMPGLPEFLQNSELPGVVAVLVAGAVAAVFALLLSGPLMRLSGLAAGLATFAVLITVNVVLSQWEDVTRGAQGIQGVPTDTTVHVALVWALIAMALAFAFQSTKFALRLRASREDEAAANSVGISIPRERALALVVSAFIVGTGGALYARFLGVFLPETFYFQLTALTIAMLVIGGRNSLAGAVVGTATVSILTEELRRMEVGQDIGPVHIAIRPGLQEVGVALFMLLILIYRPKGITAGREVPWPGRPTLPNWRPPKSDDTLAGEAKS
jgi:branched-chain amino acid transport system permease protein